MNCWPLKRPPITVRGTCTFYGTANSNQMLMEIMGLHMPSSAFIHPHSDLRHALISATMQHMMGTAAKHLSPKTALPAC